MLQDLDKRMVDVLVRPLGRFADDAELAGAGVPPAGDFGRFLLKAVDDDGAKDDYPLRLGFLDPGRGRVGAVMGPPVMGGVDLINGKGEVFVGNELQEKCVEFAYSFRHRDM